MKKFVSLFLTVALLATMLTAFAVTTDASGAPIELTGNLSTSKDYDSMMVFMKYTTNITNGTHLSFPGLLYITGTVTVEANSSITVADDLEIQKNLTINPGATVRVNSCFELSSDSKLNVGGTLKGTWYSATYPSNLSSITLSSTGRIELEFTNENYANAFANGINYQSTITHINNGASQYLVIVTGTPKETSSETASTETASTETTSTETTSAAEGHQHVFVNGECSCGEKCSHENTVIKTFCADCGTEIQDGAKNGNTASTLSEGNLTIIVGVVCLAVGFIVAMFIFKEKKNEGE